MPNPDACVEDAKSVAMVGPALNDDPNDHDARDDANAWEPPSLRRCVVDDAFPDAHDVADHDYYYSELPHCWEFAIVPSYAEISTEQAMLNRPFDIRSR